MARKYKGNIGPHGWPARAGKQGGGKADVAPQRKGKQNKANPRKIVNQKANAT